MKIIHLPLLPLAALLFFGCGNDSGAEREKSPVAVRTVRPERRTFRETVTTQAVVEPAEHALISALMPGRIGQLRAEEGSTVRRGELLFLSDRENLENARKLAAESLKIARERKRTRQADLDLAKYALVKAEADYQRDRKLIEAKAVSPAAFESATLAWQRAKLAINQAEAALASTEAEISFASTALAIAEKKLTDAAVTAPFDGVVTAKLRQDKEFCAAGTPVLKLERPGRKRVCVMLSAVHYPRIARGTAKVEVSFAGKRICTVPVSLLAPEIDRQSRTFEVKADLPAGFPLPSGTLCDVRVISGERSGTALPEGSLLFRRDGKFVVFGVADGHAAEIAVTPGITEDGFTEIVAPEQLAGREIIVSGQYFVDDGTPVTVIGAGRR